MWVLVALIGLLVVVPFLIPVGEAENTLPVRELADRDGRYLDFEGVGVHYKRAGRGEPVLVLLHGFGASLFSWRLVVDPLAQHYTVLAYDRPAFGLTERPRVEEREGRSPYTAEFGLDLLEELLDSVPVERAILVGNSAGGSVALEFALARPERVAGLVLISPAVYTSGPPGFVRLLWKLPQLDGLGPRLLRWSLPRFGQSGIAAAWHDPSRLSDEARAGYALPLRAENWDSALWTLSRSARFEPLAPHLDRVRAPVLVITGDDDRIVPTAESVRLADVLSARLLVVQQCGHLAHEECPEPVLAEIIDFVDALSR